MQKELSLKYKEYPNKEALDVQSKTLVENALASTSLAYAPYSKFKVGAAVLVEDGKVYSGANLENASYPAGLCAERVALSSVSTLAPNKKIIAIAISYINENGQNEGIISPCGICRQTIAEYENRQDTPITILLSNSLPDSKVLELPSIATLLPFMFTKESLD